MNKENTMKEEETTADYFNDIKRRTKLYAERKFLLFKLQTTQKISKITAGIVTTILIILSGLFFLVFLSITAALWIGESLGSNAAGFAIITGFYFIVFLFVMFVLKRMLQNSFINKLIQLFYKKD